MEQDKNLELQGLLEADGIIVEPESAEEEANAEPEADDVLLDEGEGKAESEKQPEAPATKKPLSKEQAAIVDLRRQLKQVSDENKQLKGIKEQEERQRSADKLKEKYLANGDDDATAAFKAEKDIKYAELEQKIALAELKAEHADTLKQFPEAKNHLAKIMKDMDATGDTFEQRCKVMFDKPENPIETRARLAARGELVSDKDSDNAVSRAERSAETPRNAALSEAERREKRVFLAAFGDKLGNMSDEDIKKYIAKHKK